MQVRLLNSHKLVDSGSFSQIVSINVINQDFQGTPLTIQWTDPPDTIDSRYKSRYTNTSHNESRKHKKYAQKITLFIHFPFDEWSMKQGPRAISSRNFEFKFLVTVTNFFFY